jgi:hypothetical protein
MTYLERLRALEQKKVAPPPPTKATKATSVGSVGTTPTPFENIEGVQAADETAADRGQESRRQRVLAMLTDHPEARYAVLTHDPGKPEPVILTLAIRGQATCELRIPRDRYDPFLLLDLIECHGATLH